MEEAGEQQEEVVLMRPKRSGRLGFLLTTSLAVLVVLGGWVATVYQDIRYNIGETKTRITDGVSAATTIRDETTATRQDMSDSFAEIQALFQPFVEASQQQDAAMQMIADEMQKGMSEPVEQEEDHSVVEDETPEPITETDSE